MQAIEQQRQHSRIAHAQSGQQEGDIRALLFAEFFVQFEKRLDRALAERQQRLDQLVVDIFVSAADDVDQ